MKNHTARLNNLTKQCKSFKEHFDKEFSVISTINHCMRDYLDPYMAQRSRYDKDMEYLNFEYIYEIITDIVTLRANNAIEDIVEKICEEEGLSFCKNQWDAKARGDLPSDHIRKLEFVDVDHRKGIIETYLKFPDDMEVSVKRHQKHRFYIKNIADSEEEGCTLYKICIQSTYLCDLIYTGIYNPIEKTVSRYDNCKYYGSFDEAPLYVRHHAKDGMNTLLQKFSEFVAEVRNKYDKIE